MAPRTAVGIAASIHLVLFVAVPGYLVYVVPPHAELFREFGVALPIFTVVTLRVSNALGVASLGIAAALYGIDVAVLALLAQKSRLAFWVYSGGVAVVAATQLAFMMVGMRLPYLLLT